MTGILVHVTTVEMRSCPTATMEVVFNLTPFHFIVEAAKKNVLNQE